MSEAFYLDGPLYDAMHKDVAGDLDFYIRRSLEAQGPVLELACGTGRVTLPIARQGVDITGLELQPSMLEQARRKADAEGLKVTWVQGDYRDYQLERRFGFIFVPFNSLLHLHAAADFAAFFACAKRHLSPNGRLLIDVFNPKPKYLLPDRPKERVLDFIDPQNGEAAWIEEQRSYDAFTQVNRSSWIASTATRKDFLQHDLFLRCLYPQELLAMVQLHGFEVEKAYGDHKEARLTSASPLQILLLKPFVQV